MLTYNGNENSYHSDISIFESIDLVLGDLGGASNVPVKELADNSAYLKKFKGTLLKGNGAPSDAAFPINFIIDANTNSNTLYLDQLTGSFWKRIGTNSWQNIGKGAVLNVKGLRLNDNGTDTNTVYLKYNATEGYLELRNHGDTDYADLRVGTLRYESADGATGTMSSIVDKEIIVLSNITSNAQNSDAYLSVKNLIDQVGAITNIQVYALHGYDRFYVQAPPTVTVGDLIQVHDVIESSGEHINRFYKVSAVQTISPYYIEINRTFEPIDAVTDKTGTNLGGYSKDNSAQLRWDNADGRFELRRRDGSLLAINVSTFLINGTPAGFTANRVIARQIDFDDLFNHVSNVNTNECYLRSPESGWVTPISDEVIYVKKSDSVATGEQGSYTLNTTVVIESNNVVIEFAPGVVINYNDTGTNPNPLGVSGNICFRFKNFTDMPVTQYLISGVDNYFAVRSTDYYFTQGPNASSPTLLPSIEPGDRPFAFCTDLTMAKKYNVQTHLKELRNAPLITDNRAGVNITLSGPYDVVYKNISGADRALVAQVIANQIRVYNYPINFDDDSVVSKPVLYYTLNIDFAPDEVKLIIGNSRGVVIASKHSGVDPHKMCYKQINLTTPSSTLGAPQYVSNDLYAINGCIINDTDLYITGNQFSATTIRVFKATIYSNMSLDTTPTVVHSVSNLASAPISHLGCAAQGTNVYISYGFLNSASEAAHYLGLIHGNNASWIDTQISATGEKYAGLYSDLIIAENPNSTGNYLAHVLYTTGITAIQKESLNLTLVDLSSTGYSYTKTLLSGTLTGFNFSSVNIFKNTANAYKSSNLITCVAVRGLTPSYIHTWSYLNNYPSYNIPNFTPSTNTSARGKISWSGGTRTGDIQSLKLFGANNDAVYFAGKDSSTALFFQHLDYVQTIQVVEPLAYGVTDAIILSNDYIENSEIRNLCIKQKGITNGPSNPINSGAYVEIANTVNCKLLGFELTDAAYRGAILGGSASSLTPSSWVLKMFHNQISDIWIDATNSVSQYYIGYFANTEFQNFYFGQSAPPGGYEFEACENLIVSGVLNNGSSIIGTGTFNF